MPRKKPYDPFVSEKSTIKWVRKNTPFLVAPYKSFIFRVDPFSYRGARKQVVEHLGKELFKELNK